MGSISLKNKNILITGAAGFIGTDLTRGLLKEAQDCKIIGIDNLNGYYDPGLKQYRLRSIEDVTQESPNRWDFIQEDIAYRSLIDRTFAQYHFDIVVNLAAQAGVRYSITDPDTYIRSNIIGFYNILEACRGTYTGDGDGVEHLVYASSSSVYGRNEKVPFRVDDKADTPVSLYAATKRADELLAHAYSKLYAIPTTGLRFFTVYGPAGRPDMAYFRFTDKLRAGEEIEIFNYGDHKRDFTYIDDITEGIIRSVKRAPDRRDGEDGLPIPPYKLYNIGKGHPESLLEFIEILCDELKNAGILEKGFDLERYKKLVPMQPGDVPTTYADITEMELELGYRPKVDLRTGIRRFACWYKDFYM